MKELIPIREFTDQCLRDQTLKNPNHYEQFLLAGYTPIELDRNSMSKWVQLHGWLNAHYPDRYTWTGNTFWFDDTKIAVQFALRFT